MSNKKIPFSRRQFLATSALRRGGHRHAVGAARGRHAA